MTESTQRARAKKWSAKYAKEQRARAEKWSAKYAKDLKHYKKVLIDNEQLRKTNQELNLMHHQAVVKVLNLGQEIIKLKGKK